MRTVLKKILTAMRGGVNELGEAVVDGQGNRILEQELRDSEHELKQAKQELARLRKCVAEVAAEHNLAPIAASTHPFAAWDRQKHTDKERYNVLARDMQAVARRLVICGMHVHAEPRSLANALIEVRQDLIDTHHGAAAWAERLAETLRAVLAEPSITEGSPEP